MSCSAVIGRGLGLIEVFNPKPVPWLTEVDTALKMPFATGERSRSGSLLANDAVWQV